MDDFVALIKAICNGFVHAFLDICAQINFPIAIEKTEWGTEIIFLGMLLNTVTQAISVPVDKRNKALRQLMDVILAKKVQVIQLQRLTGLLRSPAECILSLPI